MQKIKINVLKGKLAIGINCPEEYNGMPSKHAEMDAINKLIKKKNIPKKINVIVVRISNTGKFGNSRPCFHCLEQLEKSNLNIKNIYYSGKNGDIIKEKFAGMKEKPTTYISSGVRSQWKINKN